MKLNSNYVEVTKIPKEMKNFLKKIEKAFDWEEAGIQILWMNSQRLKGTIVSIFLDYLGLVLKKHVEGLVSMIWIKGLWWDIKRDRWWWRCHHKDEGKRLIKNNESEWERNTLLLRPRQGICSQIVFSFIVSTVKEHLKNHSY